MLHFYERIDGFFNYEEVYDDIIKLVPEGQNEKFVEIGVWKGKSVSYAAVEIIKSEKNITIDAIDSWETAEGWTNERYLKEQLEVGDVYDIFLSNIEPVKHIIKPIKMTSDEASKLYEDESLFFVYIDGNHTYDFVKSDILHWLPKVKKGGYIGGHDIDNSEWPGVRWAVNEMFGKNIKTYSGSWSDSWLYHKEG
jgi:hypothetical protein